MVLKYASGQQTVWGACGKERLEAMEEEGSMTGPPHGGVDGIGRKCKFREQHRGKRTWGVLKFLVR